MNWKTPAGSLGCLCLGLGVGVLLPFGNGGRDSGGSMESGGSVSGLSPRTRPAGGGDTNPGGGKITRIRGRSRERVPPVLEDENGGVMVSASILSELRIPGSVSSLNQDLVDGDGKIEKYLAISEFEKTDLEAAWQDARQEIRVVEAALSTSEELEDGSVRIVRPELSLEMRGVGGQFSSRVKQLLGEDRGEAFLSMKGAGSAFASPEGECVYTVAPEAIGDGSWRFRMTLEQEGNRRVWVGAGIPDEIRHLTDAANVVSSLAPDDANDNE